MALIPENYTYALDKAATARTAQPRPSKTWAIDFENGKIGEVIDGHDALIQYVYKALVTERSKYAIYTDAYGNELMRLIGEDVTPALLDSEIPRMVRDALIYDDRIEAVADIKYTRNGDTLFVSFRIIPANGGADFTTEVVI